MEQYSVPTVRKTYQYRLYPTPEQDRALETVVSRCRTLYNVALEQRKTWWGRGQGKSATYYQQATELPDLKAAYPECADVHSQVLQDVFRRVDKTYQAFLKLIAVLRTGATTRMTSTWPIAGSPQKPGGKTIVYARVSSVGQKPDLANQVAALRDYCERRGERADEWIEEVGSGLNYQRQQFNRLMEQIELGQVRRLIIAHKDRLVRFGFEWFAAFCARHGTELLIVNDDTLSPEQELVQDLLAIVHVFSARLYGLRSYKKVMRDAALHQDPTPGERG